MTIKTVDKFLKNAIKTVLKLEDTDHRKAEVCKMMGSFFLKNGLMFSLCSIRAIKDSSIKEQAYKELKRLMEEQGIATRD